MNYPIQCKFIQLCNSSTSFSYIEITFLSMVCASYTVLVRRDNVILHSCALFFNVVGKGMIWWDTFIYLAFCWPDAKLSDRLFLTSCEVGSRSLSFFHVLCPVGQQPIPSPMPYGNHTPAQEPHDGFSVCAHWVPQKAYPLVSLGFTFALRGNTTGKLKKGDQILSCSTLQDTFTSLFPFLFFYHQNSSKDVTEKRKLRDMFYLVMLLALFFIPPPTILFCVCSLFTPVSFSGKFLTQFSRGKRKTYDLIKKIIKVLFYYIYFECQVDYYLFFSLYSFCKV